MDRDKSIQVIAELVTPVLPSHRKYITHMSYCYYGNRSRLNQAYTSSIRGALLSIEMAYILIHLARNTR